MVKDCPKASSWLPSVLLPPAASAVSRVSCWLTQSCSTSV